MRVRKRGQNEHYAKPNRSGPGSDRNTHEHLGPGSVRGPVGIVVLLVLHIHFVLVVSGECSLCHQ